LYSQLTYLTFSLTLFWAGRGKFATPYRYF